MIPTAPTSEEEWRRRQAAIVAPDEEGFEAYADTRPSRAGRPLR
ncbi:hypothetical protein [Micromonospora qiuiae]|nr:hypothetical protein [Micromonospora qiuiae]